jgi:hypothetical protein
MNVKEKLNMLSRDKQLFSKISLVIAVAIVVFGASLFLTSKQFNEHEYGTCLEKGRALSDEELYQQAMKDFVQTLFDENDAYRLRKGTLGFKRQAADFYYCDKRYCDVWTAPPATYKDILELKSKFILDSAYFSLAPDPISGNNGVPKVLGWQVMSIISEAGDFKQAHNSKTILTTNKYGASSGAAIFYPIDCCEIYTLSDWNMLMQKYPNVYSSNVLLPSPDTLKYLLVKKMYAPEINLSYNGQYDRDISYGRPQAHLYAINACGRIQGQKKSLELYPNVKE